MPIDPRIIAHFKAQIPDADIVECDCDEVGTEWQPHLAVVDDELHLCFYPDPITDQIMVLAVRATKSS